jgi:hypothetical protein
MYELKLAAIFALGCAVGQGLLDRCYRMILGRVMATRWGRRRMANRVVAGYAALLTPEGTEGFQRFARELAEDFEAALDKSGFSRHYTVD